ncbi:hypothetical protein AVEN_273635-1 [Araneus ventricosus]|uniref:Uncharacterized protein n=1 Tax=Araneus ventricosus TaxID=182803 RepID=A0A4Y2LJM4_ARAVE|nr:hypothetical protein AVEN_273635-1 [Araneus ventricosus]
MNAASILDSEEFGVLSQSTTKSYKCKECTTSDLSDLSSLHSQKQGVHNKCLGRSYRPSLLDARNAQQMPWQIISSFTLRCKECTTSDLSDLSSLHSQKQGVHNKCLGRTHRPSLLDVRNAQQMPWQMISSFTLRCKECVTSVFSDLSALHSQKQRVHNKFLGRTHRPSLLDARNA